MYNHSIIIKLLLVSFFIASTRRISNTHKLVPASINNNVNEAYLRKRWRIYTQINDSLRDTLKKELNLLLSSGRVRDSVDFDRIIHDIVELIVPAKFEIFLNRLKIPEIINESNFILQALSKFVGLDQHITYSAWQYRPNIFTFGGTLTIEIHYKIRIPNKHIANLYFSPIIVFKCNVVPGKYIQGASNFNTGTIELLTHPFIPWKRYNIGTFKIRPAHLPTKFDGINL